MLIRYLRNENGQRKAVIVAVQKDGEIRIGYARCCKRDQFNRKRGLDIAVGRAEKYPIGRLLERLVMEYEENFPAVGEELCVAIGLMEERAKKYYK